MCFDIWHKGLKLSYKCDLICVKCASAGRLDSEVLIGQVTRYQTDKVLMGQVTEYQAKEALMDPSVPDIRQRNLRWIKEIGSGSDTKWRNFDGLGDLISISSVSFDRWLDTR